MKLFNSLFGEQEVPDMEGLLNHSRLMDYPTYNDTQGYGTRGALQNLWNVIGENMSTSAPPPTRLDSFIPKSKRDLERLEMMRLFQDEEIHNQRMQNRRYFM